MSRLGGVAGFSLGQKVIFYRGTDEFNLLSPDNDVWNGWTLEEAFQILVRDALPLKSKKRLRGRLLPRVETQALPPPDIPKAVVLPALLGRFPAAKRSSSSRSAPQKRSATSAMKTSVAVSSLSSAQGFSQHRRTLRPSPSLLCNKPNTSLPRA